MDCLQKGCSCNNFLVVNCLILGFIGFSKNDNSDNNLAFRMKVALIGLYYAKPLLYC